jgi:arylsulfatase A-like enzyme
MQRAGMLEAAIAATEPYIWESDANGTLRKVQPYTVENRGQVEGEIAKASVEFIERRAKAGQPFFLQVGFTYTHYPLRTAPEFVGKSRIGPYGDAIMELDNRTGQILDAIKDAGVEGNTIVIWISDNAAAPTAGPSDTRSVSTVRSEANSVMRRKVQSEPSAWSSGRAESNRALATRCSPFTTGFRRSPA